MQTLLRLKSKAGFAPAGCEFKDPRTGKVFCGYQLSMDGAVKSIIAHRRANPKLYPPEEFAPFDAVNVRQEMMKVIALVRPEAIEGMEAAPRRSPVWQLPNPELPCACGKMEADPVYCPTCMGQRVIGWKCKACGKERTR